MRRRPAVAEVFREWRGAQRFALPSRLDHSADDGKPVIKAAVTRMISRQRGRIHRIHPELRAAARVLPTGYGLHRGLTLPRIAMNMAARAGRLRSVATLTVSPGVGLRIFGPDRPESPGPVLLWLHAGGMVTGGAGQEDRFCRKLARATDVAVANVEYRLAPEHPYPAALDDAYAALLWLARQPWVDNSRIAVGGASGGGGLAAALAALCHDRDGIRPAFQMLVYPMLDDRTGADDDRPSIMWSPSDNQIAWRWYLGAAEPSLAVPGRRTDLSGLAPAWIGVGNADLFYQESMVYAHRLRDAGVPVHIEAVDGAFHAFDLIASHTSVSRRFFASQCKALRGALTDSPPPLASQSTAHDSDD